jgi:peroxiredoxin family protein
VNGATLVVFSQDLDRALAALVIANGALALGGQATLFFTFWGLNVLRKDAPPPVAGKSFMDKMFGWMMPRGPSRLPLSNMHMAGLGTAMMKQRMAAKNLPNLPGLLADARRAGARLVACSMSMEAMGLRQEELIDGIEIGGVADFLGAASATRANLFI